MPVFRLLSDPNMCFHITPIDVKYGAPLCQILRLLVQKCTPRTIKIWNFAHKFAHKGKYFAYFLRNYQNLYVVFMFYVLISGTNNQVISIFSQSGYFPTNF